MVVVRCSLYALERMSQMCNIATLKTIRYAWIHSHIANSKTNMAQLQKNINKISIVITKKSYLFNGRPQIQRFSWRFFQTIEYFYSL